MEKRVKRGEVNVTIGGTPSPVKKGTLVESNFPDPSNLAQKYGLVSSAVDSPKRDAEMEASIQSFRMEKQQMEQEYRRKLDEKNKKIDQLCVLLEALEIAPGVDPDRISKLMEDGAIDENVDFRDAKIVNLAKKSHRLQMQLNKERASTEKLNQQLFDANKSIESLNQEIAALKVNQSSKGDTKIYNRNTIQSAIEGNSAEDYLVTIAGLNRDIKESNKVIDDLKRKLSAATEENKQLSRALTRELGEGVTVEQAVSGGWRGRAQQIVMLKAKIKKLESGELGTQASTATANGMSHRPMEDVDRKAQEDLAQMSQDRRQIVEALTEERTRLIDVNVQLEKKVSAQKSRIQILESENRKLKDNLQVVLDKSTTDDQLLDALKEEISKLKSQSQASTQSKGARASDGLSTIISMSSGGKSTVKTQRDRISTVMEVDKTRNTGNMKSSAAENGEANENSISQTMYEQEQQWWESQNRQLQSEIQRLKRLCENQAAQLDTQDSTIRQLRKKLNPDFQS